MITPKAAYRLGSMHTQLLYLDEKAEGVLGKDYQPKVALDFPLFTVTSGIEVGITIKNWPRGFGTWWDLTIVQNEDEANAYIEECRAFLREMKAWEPTE